MALTKSLGGSGGGSSSLTVQDEGSTLSAAVTSINFVGLGVTGTGTTAVTATIPGLPANHPDIPPASPTLFSGVAYDIEFATVGSVGGTIVGSPATSPSIVDGALRVVGGTAGAVADLKGNEWVCPSGNFTMTAKIRRKAFNGTFWVGGPFLRVGASGAGNIEQAYSATNAAYTSLFLGCGRYTTPTARTGISTEFNIPVLPALYQRMVYNGTQVLHQFSFSGHPDSFQTVITDTLATALGGSAPGRFGIGMDTFGSTAGVIYCEWIRFT